MTTKQEQIADGLLRLAGGSSTLLERALREAGEGILPPTIPEIIDYLEAHRRLGSMSAREACVNRHVRPSPCATRES